MLTVFGSDWIDVGGLKDFAALVTLLVVALAYVLGILVDRAADTLFEAFARDEPEATPRASWKRMIVMHSSDGMSRFLEYQRSRWRIARATVANLVVAGPVAAAYLVVRSDERAWALGLLACWAVSILAAYSTATQIRHAWMKRLSDAYEIVTREHAA